jgi:hypothetical protein
MRAKIILPVSVLALAVLLPAIYFHYKSGEPAEPVASDDGTNAAPAALPAILHRVSGPALAQAGGGVPTRSDAAADLNSPEHQEYVSERKAELSQMGVSRNPAALHSILTDLHNADPDIRQSALAATMDYGSQDAIPALKNEMAWAEDPEEKAAIQKAIKFLELPTFAVDASGRLTP